MGYKQARVRRLNQARANEAGDYLLYWIQAYRRLDHNHALDYALECARTLGKPLVVYEGLRLDYPWASRRLHHFMLEANELRDVGIAFERARRSAVPLSLGLGQHPDPDGTFSFYGSTPSGFDFEIGSGGREIEPAGWQVLDTDATSNWGHKPSMRLQLRMAGGLISRKLRSRRADRPVEVPLRQAA